MKLFKQTPGIWQYVLNPTEVELLINLIKQFPDTELGWVKISNTDEDPQAAEREKLLNESLAEHRQELEKQSLNLFVGKFEPQGKAKLLTLNAEEREILLQILNGIRVGCWIALGKPETTEPPTHGSSALEFARYGLMNLAGYFEHHLIAQD